MQTARQPKGGAGGLLLVMKLFLLGMMVAYTPAMLLFAWMLWRMHSIAELPTCDMAERRQWKGRPKIGAR